MYSAIEHSVNMTLYKCCILFIIINVISDGVKSVSGTESVVVECDLNIYYQTFVT